MSPVSTFSMLQGIALRAPWPGAVLLHHCDGINRPYADHRLYAHLLGRLLIVQAPGIDAAGVLLPTPGMLDDIEAARAKRTGGGR